MPNLLAMSFEGELAPSFDLRCLHPGRNPPDGWGIGYYPAGEPCATVLKEAAPRTPVEGEQSYRSELVRAWEHLDSSIFLLHIRTATWGARSDANTQPFARSWARRDWLFAHAGSLREPLAVDPGARFEPVGATDTERIFCALMGRIADAGWASLADIDPAVLRLWFDGVNDLGALTAVLTDGRDLCIYADRAGEGSVYLCELRPPYETYSLHDDDLEVDLTRRGAKARKGLIIASNALASGDGRATPWTRVEPGHLVVVRQGALRAVAAPEPAEGAAAGGDAGVTLRPRVNLLRPRVAPVRRYEVAHRTVYRYTRAVERSSHLLRLTPAHDDVQALLDHAIRVSVDGQVRDFDDVFGNRVRRLLIDTPYTELAVEARSRVELRDTDPVGFQPLPARLTIPLVWMPWQRQVLHAFLLPPELPDSQLHELTEYAMSFVERNDYDLLDTLVDLNATIFTEYAYRQGTTTLWTTAFDVYCNRRGVCQDFANLFICLARLLGVPACYTCGYIYTGPKNPNHAQSEASHAWVQVYLPEAGWKGFDPTNGVLTQTDHVRVATGRNYVDATPTSGTIYVGGAGETLEVEVRVEPVE